MTSVKKDHAVIVQKACKRYGTKSNPYVILDELNMTVPKGCIYGLLGASGCGKTTLLSCIVGRKRLDSGEIRVLGGTPGSRGSGVPGPRVGYMPQGISLYGDFTIRETLKYFGWISKMTTEEVESKLAFYVDVLMLPHPEQKVKNLSGGQQRRVSLAAALIHEPELLILDEPTVGLDSLLRQNVWNHLIELTKDGGTTIIMTTHYIEEAKEAHLIAMLRGGYLLTEESPERLLTQFNCVSLEDVFLKLSVYQNMGKRRRSSISIGVSENIPIPAGVVNEAVIVGDEVSEISGEFGESISMSNRGHRLSISSLTNNVLPLAELPPEELPPVKLGDHFKFFNAVHMKALIWKNLLWMWRNISFMCVLILLPVTQSVLFYYTIGQPPQNLNLAIVNHELGSANEPCNFTQGCNSTKLSCYYLHFVQNLSFTLQYFDDDEAAKNQVRKGKAWAALIMAHNFSDAFRVRLDSPSYLQPWDLERSTVDVYQDISDVNIGAFVRIDLLTSFESFIRDLLKSCDKNPDSYKLPLKWGHPIYGAGIPDFADFVIPGFVLSVAFFIAVSLTVLTIVTERSEGLMERSLVNGITGMELLFSHVATQFMVMCVQNGLFIIFCFPILGYDMHGSYLLLVVLDLLTGVCGMCFGFVVSCGCDSEFTAMYISLGSFFPVVNLCGMFWPIEGMHKVVKVISYLLPLTKSTESLRCILARGWGLEKSMVYEGFIATVVWILLFLTASILIIKFKKG